MSEEKALASTEDQQLATLSEDVLNDVLGDTLGDPTGLLDALNVFRPGKGDWFEIGEEKRPDVYGIFLLSRRPCRACWEKDEITGDSPVCWSIDGTRPHELCSDVYAETCKDCPNDAIGSGQGRSKRCKTKGRDFFLLLALDAQRAAQAEMSGDPISDASDLLVGPGMLDYSIGNRGSSRSFQAWQRQVKELGYRPQGVVTRWAFGHDANKAGTEYDFVKMEVVAPLLSPQEDPAIWTAIVTAVQGLKTGQAEEILIALSGSAGEEDEQEEK